MCKCERCGEPVEECGWRICQDCYIEDCCKSDPERNLYVGGRFYGEKLVEEDNK